MIEPQSSDLNPWIRVASFEVYLILDRWGLSSVRDASVFLGISRHTLSKLSPSHPDGSLRLESLDRVYATFLHLVSFHFPEKEREPSEMNSDLPAAGYWNRVIRYRGGCGRGWRGRIYEL